MKTIAKQLFILAAIVMTGIFQACTLDDEEKCKDTQADQINVSIRIYAHNLVRNDPNIKILIEKQPCGEAPKGQFDLSGIADNFGDYQTTSVNYNLNNTEDRINVNFDYSINEYHGGEARYGNLYLSYEDLRPYDGSTLILDLGFDETVFPYWEACRQNPSTMTFCYDIVHFKLFGYPPPENEEASVTKSNIYQKLQQAGYQVSAQGGLNSSVYIQDGDVILFGTTALPNPADAQHYAIVVGNSIWQIVHWTQGGEFDGPRDPSYFLYRPKMMNPYTGVEEEPQVPFLFYMIFSKR